MHFRVWHRMLVPYSVREFNYAMNNALKYGLRAENNGMSCTSITCKIVIYLQSRHPPRPGTIGESRTRCSRGSVHSADQRVQ
jgi:hypothetical protein